MRELGARAMQIVIRHFEEGRDAPVSRELRRRETEALLRTPIPELGTPFHELLDEVVDDVLPNITHTDHPRFYAFVPSPINFVSVIGDLLAAGHNVFAGHWLSSSTAAQVEIIVLDWLKEMCGLPAGAGGVLVSGGSMANLSAIATAREARLGGPDDRAVVYCSDQTHSSLSKGLRVLGFRRDQRHVVATDGALRLSLPALEAAIAADRAAGRRPFVVVANAGTTNTGAVDPLGDIADLCEREGLWLHVDGAYGAAAVITARGRALLPGLDRADSITLDPHKWLFQPYEVGCLLVRDARHLQRAFRVEDEDHADYLVDVMEHIEGEVNFFERGVQLTRAFRALKLWLSLRTFGLAEFRRAIDVGLDLAEHAERCLRLDSRWEIVTPAQLGVVTFRWRGDGIAEEEGDVVIRRVVREMISDGYALVLSTSLKGRLVLRLCPMHPGGERAEIEETVRRLAVFAECGAVQAQ
jgi:glutamate/tyrosine decarboxylase-like PLP-dependent enzyme